MMRKLLIGALMGGFVALASGCLITSGKTIDESGVRITSSTLDQVVPGETTESWLVATLGQPTERTEVDGEHPAAVLRYDFIEHRNERGKIFLLLSTRSKKKLVTRTYFEVIDGYVTRTWREG